MSEKKTIKVRTTVTITTQATYPASYPNMTLAEAIASERDMSKEEEIGYFIESLECTEIDEIDLDKKVWME